MRKGVVTGSHVVSVGRCPIGDAPFDPVNTASELLNKLNKEYFPVIDPAAKLAMREEIEKARLEKDSVGGIVECAVLGLPVGAGEPMFGGTENLFASILFGIPAVKGVEFGAGFSAAYLRGSENNDAFHYDAEGNVKTRTNYSGGILGGITSGMPLIFQTAFKPTPSIGREQDTIDLQARENAKLVVEGRHDPCIVPRAAPVVEAAACIASLELLARTADAGSRYGIPTLGVVAVGKEMARTEKFFLLATRVLAENGANVVKSYYCEGFERVAAACPVPIVIAGGKKLPELEALEMAYKAIQEGAHGVDMGRNIFQSDSPAGMAQAIGRVVHEGFTPAQAYEVYQEVKNQR